MPRSWTPEQKARQAESTRARHAAGRYDGAVRQLVAQGGAAAQKRWDARWGRMTLSEKLAHLERAHKAMGLILDVDAWHEAAHRAEGDAA